MISEQGWSHHEGGPQPAADDVFVEIRYNEGFSFTDRADFFAWDEPVDFRIVNQHLIDAKQAEIDALKDDIETWQSVFPYIMPDDLKSDQQLLEEDVAAKIDAARKEGFRQGLEAAIGEIEDRDRLAMNCPDGGGEWLRPDHMIQDIRSLKPKE